MTHLRYSLTIGLWSASSTFLGEGPSRGPQPTCSQASEAGHLPMRGLIFNFFGIANKKNFSFEKSFVQLPMARSD